MNKVDPILAQQEFERWAEDWGMDIDVDSVDDDTLQEYEKLQRRLIASIVRGDLVIDEGDEGVIAQYEFTKANKIGKEVVFKEPNGAALMKTQAGKNANAIDQMFNFLGHITGTAPRMWSSVSGRDLKVAQAVATLFLGS